MKKQYKVLANKAGFTNCTPTIADWLEKYAELVIAECIVAANTNVIAHAAGVEKNIKKHFEENNDIQR